MSNAKFTPRPWKVIDRSKDGAIKTVISDRVSVEDFPFEINMPAPPFALGACGALVARKGGMGNEGSSEDTARLIAAAPEMYEALKAIAEECSASPDGVPQWSKRWDAVYAALAKAVRP